MKVEGSHTFEAPRDFVWETILNPEVLANTLPGVQQLEQTGDNEYKATMKIRLGPVQGVFTGSVNLSDLNPPESCRLHVDGKGAPGFVLGDGQLELEGQGESTLLRYNGDAQIGGRLASVGQRLMESSTQALIQQSLVALDAQVVARYRGEEAGEEFQPPEPPSQLEFAAAVTRRMLEDSLPAGRSVELLRGGLAILGVLFLLRLFLNWWTDKLANQVADILEQRNSQ